MRAEVGDEVVVCADTCLDEFTSHGHCGLIRPDGPRAGEVAYPHYRLRTLESA